MISYLAGTILLKASDYIILSTGNVGYKVFLSAKTSEGLREGSEFTTFCHLYLRKDETLELYGLPSAEQLQLFSLLNDISGVGPKAALAMASLGSVTDFKKALAAQDSSFFAGIKGIGTKKVQKVILELTGKIDRMDKKAAPEDEDALTALVSLGIPRQKAKQALDSVDSALTTEERVGLALKLIRR
ncbi:MAG: Holliday junction branch migration protein RuvA [bacterium]|nr:Holliday junction branch migration protein RuvA [bacterium]